MQWSLGWEAVMKVTYEQALSLAALGSVIRYKDWHVNERGYRTMRRDGFTSSLEVIETMPNGVFEDLGPPGKPTL
jgi:hypothetical protein